MTEKKYGTKQEIVEMFGVKKGTLNNDLTKMRRNPKFAQYVIRKSYKVTLVNVVGYEEFIKYCERLQAIN
ncbi:DNA-binding protein [Lactococcus taiwanensis]|uniref:DNA-binding protein n=1 Tax=Lactococcus taiwanensis TaxID=1151742 RepID=A0AA45KG21_9LACT|nr:DNA-binding protein [Lactococcus taiwanensis]QSE76685.1 DNA-binding protein [Lactococcus taiwanensis]